MYKRVIAVLMVLILGIGATRTVYAAEEMEVIMLQEEIREEAQSGPSESEPEESAPENYEPESSGSESSAPDSAPVSEAASAAAESISAAQEVIVTELDVASDILPYLEEAAVYIGGGVLPAPEAPAMPAPAPAEPSVPAPAEAGATEAAAPEIVTEESAPEGTEVTGAVEDLKKAEDLLEEATPADTTELEEKLDNTKKELKTFKEKEQEAREEAEEATESAETANETSSKKEATEAKAHAENALAVAETRLMEATDAYDEARKNANEAEDAYEKALKEHEAAQAKIEEAKAALESAKNNSTAAMEALKIAQQNAVRAEEKVKKLRDSKTELEDIKDQYYASMVYYYRNLLGRATEYQDDGTLDIEANAKKVVEEGKAESAATSPDQSSMQLNRYLAKMLIDYMISNDENVDPETANLQIAVKEAGLEMRKASEGTVFTNNEGVDQTVVTGSKKDINGETVYAGEQTELYQKRSNQNDNGRTNRLKVTYTDKDGVEHVEYYNYIFKSKKYDDGMDIENGPIYLALVRYNDESGKWETSRVEDENNYDDYSKLTKALQAIEDLEKYEQARMAVDEAVEKVAQLEEMIASLSIESPGNLNVLEEALAEAREELDEAYEKKHELEGVVEEARKAVAGIDLSRFNIQRVDPETEEAEPSGGTYTEAAQEGFTPSLPAMVQSIPDATGLTGESLVSQLPVMPIAFLPMEPVATPTEGLMAESPFVNITLASTERAAQAAETANNLFSLRSAQLPDAMTPEGDSVDLDEGKLPGANATPVDEKSKHWWTWLLLAFAALTGWHFLKKKDSEEEDEAKS